MRSASARSLRHCSARRRPEVRYWSVEPEWKGETAYIIAGGPSVAEQDVSQLRGRRLIVVNSSYQVAPFADFLVFGDHRWWLEHRKHLDGFAGRIVTTANIDHPKVLRLKKAKIPPGLASDRSSLFMNRTSTEAALNLVAHLEVARLGLLGFDMRGASDGRTHHHTPHRWATRPGCWDRQMAELRAFAAPLRERGIAVFNASPVSRIDWWPKCTFEECLAWQT